MECGCYRSLTLPRGVMGWYVVCDCGIFWSYSLTFSVFLDCALGIIVVRFLQLLSLLASQFCIKLVPCACKDPENFSRLGHTWKSIFLVDEGRKDPNTSKSGSSSAPPAKRHINGVPLAC